MLCKNARTSQCHCAILRNGMARGNTLIAVSAIQFYSHPLIPNCFGVLLDILKTRWGPSANISHIYWPLAIRLAWVSFSYKLVKGDFNGWLSCPVHRSLESTQPAAMLTFLIPAIRSLMRLFPASFDMAQRVTLRKRQPYNTNSNRRRVVKTPGGKLVYHHLKKPASAPKCGDCGISLPGVRYHATWKLTRQANAT